mgnify:FL=1
MSKVHKGKLGYWSGKTRVRGENHKSWKGNKTKNNGLHAWVKKYKILPKVCEHCGQEKVLELAHKNHKYNRVLEDYMYLCRSCHRKYDIKYNNYKLTASSPKSGK